MKHKQNIVFKEPVKIRLKKLADGSSSLYLDTYIKGSREYQFLNLYLYPELDKNIREINRQTMVKAITGKARRLVELSQEIEGNCRRDADRKMTLKQWLDVFLESEIKRGCKNPEKLSSVFKVIKKFDPDGKVLLPEIDKEWLMIFIEWLKNDYRKGNGKRLGNGTIIYYLSRFSYALNFAKKSGLIKENPFNGLEASEKLKKPESVREFLTVEELKRLIATDCRYETVKAAYLFSCYCGLRISDIKNLRYDNVIPNDGRFMISVTMKKTGRPVFIPLSKNALKWLPLKRGDDRGLIFRDLPCLTTINTVIKEWAKRAGIKKKITYHTSRHTFGTLMITAGADIYVTSKLMGHSDVKTTQIYARIIDSKKIEAVSKLDRMFAL